MDDDITAAISRLGGQQESEVRAKHFPIPAQFAQRRVKGERVARDRAAARKCIRAENAVVLLDQLPLTSEASLHAVIPGDFVFGDILPLLVARHGCPTRLDITTLSLSEKNVQDLLAILNHSDEPQLTLLLSYYFKSTNKDIFRAIEILLMPHSRFRLAIGRVHTKIILFDCPALPLVIESSANLRSSNSIEQVTALCCPELLQFHRGWIDQFHALAATGNHESMISFKQ